MIIYLHGFRSSPASSKSQHLQAYMTKKGIGHLFACPHLPYSPRQAIALIINLISKSTTPITLIGSSLGGYYASWLTEMHRVRAVLINPAVVAHLSLVEYVGPQTDYHTGKTFEFKAEYIDELREIDTPRLRHPKEFLLMVEKGDEVLDYRQAVAKYAGCQQIVLDGGNHSFIHFEKYIDTILKFSGLV